LASSATPKINVVKTAIDSAGHFILKKWKLPLSGLAVVRYSDKCVWAKKLAGPL